MDSARESTPHRPAHSGAQIPPATLDGWYVLHQLFRVDWHGLKSLTAEARTAVLGELGRILDERSGGHDEGWSGAYRMVGAGVDLMLVHFRPTLDDLTIASREVALADVSEFLLLDHEYLSVVELGMYGVTVEVADRVDVSDNETYREALAAALEEHGDKEYVKRRLFPTQPESMPYVCYYPMDKRRETGQNWYSLPLETRAELMHAHGTVGRRYAGRISQIISGSVGLADWEWAVTLFAPDPLCFKEVITEMRYDEASADYAEFGSFFVGRRMSNDQLIGLLE